MRSRVRLIIGIFLIFILLIDLGSYFGLRHDFVFFKAWYAAIAFWLVPVFFVTGLLYSSRNFLADNKPGFFSGFYVFTGVFLACYLPKMLYFGVLLIENILIPPLFLVDHFFESGRSFSEFYSTTGVGQLSIWILPLSVFTFLLIIWGILFGRFNFKIRPVGLYFNDLPAGFDDFRIIHISDMHLGSLQGHQRKIEKAVRMIMEIKPDLILFTGDLVNNLASETNGWIEILSKMNAPYGMFSILGNHDYGEYYHWESEAKHRENMDLLIKAHNEIGFRLLLNQSVAIEKNHEKIFLAGVENWGLPPFKQYGDLHLALGNIPPGGFTLLLSHDPSHWDAEVVDRTDVRLTLSGHTHGMQFGIRLGTFRWSPIKIKYPRWTGLYRQGHQYLHVNPGLGYIGYAGRIGIPPEISLISLHRSDNPTV